VEKRLWEFFISFREGKLREKQSGSVLIFPPKAVPVRSLRDFTSVFGMGTGVAPSLWPPVSQKGGVSFLYLKEV
jgi:hypothetical protein